MLLYSKTSSFSIMNFSIRKITKDDLPESLFEIPEQPENLYYTGTLPIKENKKLCVVGSRRYTPYGKEACEKLIKGLAGYPITIVSGLALGIDCIAHESAISVGLQTIAVPGSGLDPSVLYPRSNINLADRIIKSGGGLFSEFDLKQKALPWTFPKRNRIMAGFSDAILVIEAEEKSGTLITSRLATDYNKEVFAVPGSIFSPGSYGPHMLIRLGATPIRNADDILDAFGFKTEIKTEAIIFNLSEEEKEVLEIIKEPISRNDILRMSQFPTSQTQAIIMSLEISGVIEERLGKITKI